MLAELAMGCVLTMEYGLHGNDTTHDLVLGHNYRKPSMPRCFRPRHNSERVPGGGVKLPVEMGLMQARFSKPAGAKISGLATCLLVYGGGGGGAGWVARALVVGLV